MNRICLLRILLGILLILNLIMIFSFSAESAAESGQTSKSVTRFLVRLVDWDFNKQTPDVQEALLEKWHLLVRKLAHMTEFGMLCGWSVLLLRTWKLLDWQPALFSLLFTAAVASVDEFSQHSGGLGRAGQISDVLIDLLGGLTVTAFLYFIFKLRTITQGRTQKKT